MSRRAEGLAAALLLVAVAVAAVGCGRAETTAGAGAAAKAPLPPADATYRVRGVVRALPAQAGGDMTVYHEAIPDFVDRRGERTGMDSMSMPFSVAPSVDLSGVAPDDKVDITFELRWANANLRIVRLAELPPETELALGAAAAPAAATPAASPSAADPHAAHGDH